MTNRHMNFSLLLVIILTFRNNICFASLFRNTPKQSIIVARTWASPPISTHDSTSPSWRQQRRLLLFVCQLFKMVHSEPTLAPNKTTVAICASCVLNVTSQFSFAKPLITLYRPPVLHTFAFASGTSDSWSADQGGSGRVWLLDNNGCQRTLPLSFVPKRRLFRLKDPGILKTNFTCSEKDTPGRCYLQLVFLIFPSVDNTD